MYAQDMYFFLVECNPFLKGDTVMKKIFVLVTALVFTIQVRVHADEGMWLLPLLEKLNMDKMISMGLNLI